MLVNKQDFHLLREVSQDFYLLVFRQEREGDLKKKQKKDPNDPRKAFDMLDHSLLLQKMARCGIGGMS